MLVAAGRMPRGGQLLALLVLVLRSVAGTVLVTPCMLV